MSAYQLVQLLHVSLHGSASEFVPCHVHKHGGRVGPHGALLALGLAGQKGRRHPHNLGAYSLQQGKQGSHKLPGLCWGTTHTWSGNTQVTSCPTPYILGKVLEREFATGQPEDGAPVSEDGAPVSEDGAPVSEDGAPVSNVKVV